MSINRSIIEKEIIAYIHKNSHSDLEKLTPQTLLFKEGLFDSMGFVLLIDFIEEGFSIKTSDDDLIEENFESISAIVNYIQRKKATVVNES